MTREEFDRTRSWGEHSCPDCGSKATHPTPGCHCPPNPSGYGTLHINKWHHTCQPPSEQEVILRNLASWGIR